MSLPWTRLTCYLLSSLILFTGHCPRVIAQASRDADKYEGIVDYLKQRVEQIEANSAEDLATITPATWDETRSAWRSELREMLGIPDDLPKTDLQTTTVGSIQLDDVRVDRLHYQSHPGLFVAANLYVPRGPVPESGWPAVLYVCGHARVTDHGRLLGNKTAYQHHGLWLAKHGFVCLMIDTVQLGEFHGEHHGTYKLGCWDWISRGYTPAGVEAWNAVRGVDLLCGLPQVDASKIGVTGRSGGGIYSWLAAALDERIQVAIPVAGITDLRNHVIDGCVEGHCDCMYFVNYHRWDYAKLAALVAPRALLLENSDSDSIFPLDGVMRIHRQLSSLYEKLDASDQYGLVITPGPHKDTQDLRVPAFRFLKKHLQGEADPIVDTPATKDLNPELLAVFEREIPQRERVTSVAGWFAPTPEERKPDTSAWDLWQSRWLPQLRHWNIVPEMSESGAFHKSSQSAIGDRAIALWESANGTQVLQIGSDGQPAAEQVQVALVLDGPEWTSAKQAANAIPERFAANSQDLMYVVRWSGSDWRQDLLATPHKQHQIVRRFYLLGETPEQLAMWEWMQALGWITDQTPAELHLLGDQRSATLAILLGLLGQDAEANMRVTGLKLGSVPHDAKLAACLPGLAQVCTVQDLLDAAESKLVIEHADPESSTAPYLVDTSPQPQQATGMRIVEVTAESAKIWVRATRWPLANLADLPEVRFEVPNNKHSTGAILPELGADGLRFAVPGVAAEARVGIRAAQGDYRFTPWRKVEQDTDFSTLFELEDLAPGQQYSVRTQVRSTEDAPVNSLTGSFRTLPGTDTVANFRLAISTCQSFEDRDGPHGFDMYRTIQDRGTDAFVLAGDVVYYDRLARSKPLAFYHWQRTYSLPTLIDFHRQVPSYFLKDDHDTYVNDSWPGQKVSWTEDFEFVEGQKIFREQTGLPTPAFRSFRIGSDLQVWLMEGRDFRSPNNAEDGPGKTIWGPEQKQWLESSLQQSQAKFKVVVSPTPLVGPDRKNKRDNHSNQGFQHEGQEVCALLASIPNTVAVCGDRHWQFHSVDPATGLHEFSVGPASDRHAGGWRKDDYRPDVHRYLRVAGGYLEIELRGTEDRELVIRHLDTHGNEYHRHTLR